MIYTRFGSDVEIMATSYPAVPEVTIKYKDTGKTRSVTISDLMADDGINEIMKAVKKLSGQAGNVSIRLLSLVSMSTLLICFAISDYLAK